MGGRLASIGSLKLRDPDGSYSQNPGAFAPNPRQASFYSALLRVYALILSFQLWF
jgi:hypothetical protein